MAEENTFTWRGQLDEEHNTNPAMEPYSDDLDGFKKFAKSYINQQKLIGADKLPLLGEDATEEEKAEFWGKLGAPGSADGYELGIPEGAPEGFQIPDGLDEIVRKAAAEVHAPKGVAEKLWSALVGNMAERFGTSKETNELQRAKLVEAFHNSLGAAKDEKLKAVEQAIFTLTRNAPDVQNWLNSTGLAQHPFMQQLILNASDGLKTDSAPGGGGTSPLTPAEAQAKIARIEETDGWMGNDRLVKQRTELYKFAYPE